MTKQPPQPITEQVVGKLKIKFDASFKAVPYADGQPLLQVLFQDQLLLNLDMPAQSITSQTQSVTIQPDADKENKVTIILYEYSGDNQRSNPELFVESLDEAGDDKFGGSMIVPTGIAMEPLTGYPLGRRWGRQVILIEPVRK